MKRLMLVVSALLAAAPCAAAWAQRAEHSGEQAHVRTDTPPITVRNARLDRDDGGPALEDRPCCTAQRGQKAGRFQTVLSVTTAYGFRAPANQDAWICMHAEGMRP